MSHRPIARRMLRVVPFVLTGLLAAVLVAVGLAAGVDPRSGESTSASALDGESKWAVTRTVRPGAVYVLSVRDGTVRGPAHSWSAWQATGAPNTNGPGDLATAWASASQDSGVEWLELMYAKAVVPKAVVVYETYNPGALIKASAFDSSGKEVEAWRGTDPSARNPAKVGVSRVPLGVSFATSKVRVYLDSAAVPGWNEIDAVGLEDASGSVQWAIGCRASSVYGAGSVDALPQVAALLPRWSGLDESGEAFASGKAVTETRSAAAWGWPVPVIAGENEITGQTVAPGTTSLTAPVFGGPVAPSLAPLSPPSVSSGRGPYPLGGMQAVPSGTTVFLGTGSVPAGPPPTPAPRRLLWAGWLVDGLIYAAILFVLRLLLVSPLRFVREVSRIRGGRCIACGYDLGYDFPHGCPECGWRRDNPTGPVLSSNGDGRPRSRERAAAVAAP